MIRPRYRASTRALRVASLAAFVLAAAAADARGQEPRIARIEALLRRHDADGDGVVKRAEAKSEELYRKYDADKNGEITVPELLKAEGAPLDATARARLLGRVPEIAAFSELDRCDFDGDGALDYDELKVLVFAFCDRAPRDGKLELKECAASPAPTASNLKTGWLAREFRAADRERDGILRQRDFDLPPAFLKGLDRDGDGRASFDELVADEIARQGGYVKKFAAAAAYFAKAESAKPADWPGDAEGFRRLDENDDGLVTAAEFDRYARRLRATLGLATEFLLRFDLDGDGKVARPEFPGADATFARLDVDRDGYVTAKDRAAVKP